MSPNKYWLCASKDNIVCQEYVLNGPETYDACLARCTILFNQIQIEKAAFLAALTLEDLKTLLNSKLLLELSVEKIVEEINLKTV